MSEPARRDASRTATLQKDDPLYPFLRHVLVAALGVDRGEPTFLVSRLGEERGVYWVYLYTEPTLGVRVVCKFYGTKPLFDGWIGSRQLRSKLMHREFSCLQEARALGLDMPPNEVVRPLAASREINCALVEDFAPGADLMTYTMGAIEHGRREPLSARLEEVAGFLFELHDRTRGTASMDGDAAAASLLSLADQLQRQAVLRTGEAAELKRLGERWARSGVLSSATAVRTHGDPGLSHFLFDGAGNVVAIDLEELKPGDPAQDLGWLMAELTHVFFRCSLGEAVVQPYLDGLLEAYLRLVQQRGRQAGALQERCTFYRSYFLACIGRNYRLDLDYRRAMIAKARTELET